MVDKPSSPKRFHLVATSPCEVRNCFCAPRLNIMKIQGVPGNSVVCAQKLARAREHMHCRHQACTYTLFVHRNVHIPSPVATTHTCTHLFAWWTFIRMQRRGIMWFKQSRSWQTRSPTELKISPNTLRDQIIGPYVDLAQSSQTLVCVQYVHVCLSGCGACLHTCTALGNINLWICGGGI